MPNHVDELQDRDGDSPSAAPGGRTGRVVIVERDGPMRALLADLLRRDGFEVLEVAAAQELLDRLGDLLIQRGVRGTRFDLVIADLCADAPDGLAVLARLRRAERETPFILMTAFADERTRRDAERLGASAVFDKPFDLDDLRTAVFHWVAP